jgi:hypothetical protein
VIELSSQAFVPKGGFRLVPFGAQIVAQAVGRPAYPLLAFPFAPNRPTEAKTPRAKMMRAAIPNVGCRIIVISPPATSLSRSSVERSVRIRPAQVVPAAKTAGGRDCRSPYFSRSNAISDLDLE